MSLRRRRHAQDRQRIAAIRRFNRFYTRQIGVLRKTYLDSPFSLGEARVLYEIGGRQAPTASEIGRALDLDAGYLSRLLRSFEKRGLIERKASAADARQSLVTLSARGRNTFAPLEQRSERLTGAMLERLTPAQQDELIAAMTTIETLLDGKAAEAEGRQDPGAAVKAAARAGAARYRLRAPRPGDFGWIVKRHAEIYAQEYGWTGGFEGVCAKIVADFVNHHDPERERCWIAEIDGDNVGSVILANDSDTVARIRLLLVEPAARGLGLGARLTAECIGFARRTGFRKITLWTHAELTAARHIYKKAGFVLTGTEQHASFGRPAVSEFWDLDL